MILSLIHILIVSCKWKSWWCLLCRQNIFCKILVSDSVLREDFFP